MDLVQICAIMFFFFFLTMRPDWDFASFPCVFDSEIVDFDIKVFDLLIYFVCV